MEPRIIPLRLSQKQILRYPRMLPKSAHVIFEDSKKRIWIAHGEAGCMYWKMHMIRTMYVGNRSHMKTACKKLPHDIIYSISEDINSRNIWIGTSLGLSYLNDESKGTFTNFYPSEKDETISDAEVTSLLCDKQGMMWIGMLRGGVNTVSTRKPFLNHTP